MPETPLTPATAVASLVSLAAWCVLGVVLVAMAVAFWPIALTVAVVVGVVKYSAREFARANRR